MRLNTIRQVWKKRFSEAIRQPKQWRSRGVWWQERSSRTFCRGSSEIQRDWHAKPPITSLQYPYLLHVDSDFLMRHQTIRVYRINSIAGFGDLFLPSHRMRRSSLHHSPVPPIIHNALREIAIGHTLHQGAWTSECNDVASSFWEEISNERICRYSNLELVEWGLPWLECGQTQ